MTPSDWLFNDMTDWHGYKAFFTAKKGDFYGNFIFFVRSATITV